MTIYVVDIETKTDFKTLRMVGVLELAGKGDPHRLVHYPYSADGFKELVNNNFDSGDIVFTWNGEGFDFPVLGFDPKPYEDQGVKFIDGMLLSKMLYPDRYQHSLASWAKDKLSEDEQKLEVDYDNAPLSELAVYLKRDLDITLEICCELYEEYLDKFPNSNPLRVEQGVRRLVNESRDRGFGFDTRAAQELNLKLFRYKRDLSEYSATIFPKYPLPTSKIDHPPKKQFKADGDLTVAMYNWLNRNFPTGYRIVTVPRTIKAHEVHTPCGSIYPLPIKEPLHTEFQLRFENTKELKEYFIENDWKPTMWNTNKEGKQTSPMFFNKITGEPCPDLYRVAGRYVVDKLRKYSVANSRLNSLRGMIERCTDEGVIHADADTCGTPTARFKHRTIVNIPRVSSDWGKEFRELYRPAASSNVQVGWDASSLEAVMEAHYVYPFDKDYAEELVTGDVHTRNMTRLGLPNRDVAKTFKYMLTYGAKPKRVSESLNVSLTQATEWYDEFWNENEGLYELIKFIETQWKGNNEKFIVGLDGRPLYTRYRHALLNTLLQGGGSILMKHAFLIAEKRIRSEYGGVYPLIRYHDEEQWEASPLIAAHVGQIGVQSITQAGLYLNLNVPITGEYKVGANWAECH